LNLSWEVREGLAKASHRLRPSRRAQKGFAAKNSSLEAQIANLADEITYYSHDLDDGLDSELLSEKELSKNVRVWAQAARAGEKRIRRCPMNAAVISRFARSLTCKSATWWKPASASLKKPTSNPPMMFAVFPSRSSNTVRNGAS
jgi:dGTP triphosphohydrolase